MGAPTERPKQARDRLPARLWAHMSTRSQPPQGMPCAGNAPLNPLYVGPTTQLNVVETCNFDVRGTTSRRRVVGITVPGETLARPATGYDSSTGPSSVEAVKAQEKKRTMSSIRC